MTATVVVVGLGPGGADLLTQQSLAVLQSADRLWLRTRRHPAADVVPDAPSFDAVYEENDTFEQVYADIVEQLVSDATAHGRIIYAVPGSPSVAERTVELLLADHRVAVELVPALSFLDLAWTRLGVDPLADGVVVVDGHRFAEQVAGRTGPFLVAQCDQPWVLSDIKLSVDDPDDELSVTVVQRLGLPDESIVEVRWNELDRVSPDHLTSLWVPWLPMPAAVAFGRFEQMVARLREECPWDAEQTHDSLRKYLIEETYEVLEAIELAQHADDHLQRSDSDAAWLEVCEELGDVLYQVFFHAVLASERGHFAVADVATAIHDKLWVRHPHVFGATEVTGTDEVVANWEEIKKAEKAASRSASDAGQSGGPHAPSVLDGVPSAMPSLMFAGKVDKRVGAFGLGPQDFEASVADLRTALDVLANSQVSDQHAGTVLAAAVQVVRLAGSDPETVLRDATRRTVERFKALEVAAHAQGIPVDGMPLAAIAALWAET